MRWFKHLTLAQDDEKLSHLMDEFGAEGYGVWWLILEKIGRLMDESDDCFASYSLKVWATSCKVSPKKLQNIIKFLEKNKMVLSKMEDGKLTITCPNLLKYRDEFTRKKKKEKQKTPEPLRTTAGHTPEQDTDTDTDTETDNTPPDPPKGGPAKEPLSKSQKSKRLEIPSDAAQQIISRFTTILPELPRPVAWEQWSRQRKSSLNARWKEMPDLEHWDVFFQKIRGSPHLLGKTPANWKASIDWVIKPENFAKIQEGVYQQKHKTLEEIF